MANIIPRIAGKLVKPVQSVTSAISPYTTGPINKAWRAAILLHRKSTTPHQDISKKDPAKGNNVVMNEYNRDYQRSNQANNQIIIYNISTDTYKYIVIQNRPNKIEFRGESSWASIKSMGRNTPMYHYTGAEDIIQINISWYCDDPNNPEEVINKCRLLEAWTKSNGYIQAPPVLFIQWGNSDMFKDQEFILTSATYTLSNFNNAFYTKDGLVDGKLLPSVATQELIFKRVSSTNLLWEDMLATGKAKKTKGIQV
jgi:hypothetical protein